MKLAHILFFINYSRNSTNLYCILKREEILNLTIFARFSFLQLHNIRGTCFKYFLNNVYETDTSCVEQFIAT